MTRNGLSDAQELQNVSSVFGYMSQQDKRSMGHELRQGAEPTQEFIDDAFAEVGGNGDLYIEDLFDLDHKPASICNENKHAAQDSTMQGNSCSHPSRLATEADGRVFGHEVQYNIAQGSSCSQQKPSAVEAGSRDVRRKGQYSTVQGNAIFQQGTSTAEGNSGSQQGTSAAELDKHASRREALRRKGMDVLHTLKQDPRPAAGPLRRHRMKTLPMKCTNTPVDDPPSSVQLSPSKAMHPVGAVQRTAPNGKQASSTLPVRTEALKPGPCGDTGALLAEPNWLFTRFQTGHAVSVSF